MISAKAILVWATLIALIFGGWRASLDPIPLHPPTANQVRTGSQHESKQAGSEQSDPKPSIVQPAPARATGPDRNERSGNSREHENQRAESEQSKPTDWVQGISAAVSAVVAVCLFIATRQQIRIAERQASVTEDQLAIVARQTDIMEMQKSISAEGLDIAAKQKEISRLAIVSASRPYLILNTDFDKGRTFDHTTSTDVPYFEFWYTNYGTAPAIVKESMQDMRLAPVIADDPVSEEFTSFHYYVILQGKSTSRFKIRLDAEHSEVDLLALDNHYMFLYVFGVVIYEGMAGDRHETRFYWQYNPAAKQFQERHGEQANHRS